MSDSPQLEDGYTRIANELIEKFAKINLSKYEWRLLWVVIRKTYGWKKKYDHISVTQLSDLSGIDRRNTSRTKKNLIDKKILIENNGMLAINKNSNEWLSSLQTIVDVVYRDTRPQHFHTKACSNLPNSRDTRCELCMEIFLWEHTQNHHIVPKSMGGKNTKANLIRLCLGCHSSVHNQMKSKGVSQETIGDWYRHFMSKVSSLQTQFLSSLQTSTKENINKNTKERSLRLKNKFSDDDMITAKWIYEKLLNLNPKEKKPNLESWANTIRLMRERDERTHKEICTIFKFANDDHFWQHQIRSPVNLRKHFDRLTTLSNQGKSNENSSRISTINTKPKTAAQIFAEGTREAFDE